jgi:hypothetical protein
VGRSEADRSAGFIKEEYETQAGRTEAPTARSPVAGTVDAVKPLHAPWPSSTNHTYLDRLTVSVDHGQKRELGGVTIGEQLTSTGPLQKGVYRKPCPRICIHARLGAPLGGLAHAPRRVRC